MIILLVEERIGDERMFAASRELASPLDELDRCLAELAVPGGRPAARRQLFEDAASAVAKLRKRAEELVALLTAKS